MEQVNLNRPLKTQKPFLMDTTKHKTSQAQVGVTTQSSKLQQVQLQLAWPLPFLSIILLLSHLVQVNYTKQEEATNVFHPTSKV